MYFFSKNPPKNDFLVISVWTDISLFFSEKKHMKFVLRIIVQMCTEYVVFLSQHFRLILVRDTIFGRVQALILLGLILTPTIGPHLVRVACDSNEVKVSVCVSWINGYMLLCPLMNFSENKVSGSPFYLLIKWECSFILTCPFFKNLSKENILYFLTLP